MNTWNTFFNHHFYILSSFSCHFYSVIYSFVENLAFRVLSSLIPLLRILPFGGPHSIDFRNWTSPKTTGFCPLSQVPRHFSFSALCLKTEHWCENISNSARRISISISLKFKGCILTFSSYFLKIINLNLINFKVIKELDY